MATIIKDIGGFAKALAPNIKEILVLVAEDVKEEVDKTIDDYYSEYDPNPYNEDKLTYKKYWYNRTYQLRDCCKIGQPKISGNIISIEIYLDIESLNYNTPGSDPYKTVVAANAGLHGGWDVGSMMRVPWSSISSNSGAPYGNGTQIWEEPIRDLLDTGKLVIMFKKYANQRGLKIK